MKNWLKVDHVKHVILMDRTYAKKAENTRSDEYRHLQDVRRDYPEYTVMQRHIKKNSSKKTYHGLTYEFMEDYILTHGKPETIKQNLHEFNEMRIISRCHGAAFRYPIIKSWFLETYPEIMEYGIEMTSEIVEIGNPDSEETPLKMASGF